LSLFFLDGARLKRVPSIRARVTDARNPGCYYDSS